MKKLALTPARLQKLVKGLDAKGFAASYGPGKWSVREIIGTVNRLVAAADVSGAPLTVAVARAELDPEATSAPRPTTPAAVRAAADTFFLDDEKVVWEWTDASTRMIEELK